MPPTLSIVFGTLNRLPFLERALASIPEACGDLSYEIVIADGGSTDGTIEFLLKQRDVKLLQQGTRLGAVKAFNAAFNAAIGEFVAAFNDDAEYRGAPLANAVAKLRAEKTIGQVAIPFLTHPINSVIEIPERVTGTPETQNVALPNLGFVPYANFGVIARALGDKLGWWSEYYYTYAGDTELSTQVWAKGLRVVALDPRDGYLIHWQVRDDTRVPNVETAQFNRRWRGNNSPFLQMPPMPERVRVRYLGGRHGGLEYQRPGSSVKYRVSAADALFDAGRADAEWLLTLKERGRRLFERVLT